MAIVIILIAIGFIIVVFEKIGEFFSDTIGAFFSTESSVLLKITVSLLISAAALLLIYWIIDLHILITIAKYLAASSVLVALVSIIWNIFRKS